jgi:hypothetical protein
MRTVLRRRLNEPVAGNWSDADLNDLLNTALVKVQADIMKVSPLAFVNIWHQDVVAAQEFYDKPVGLQYEYLVRLKDTTSGLYFQIRNGDYYALVSRNLTLGTPPQNFNSIVPETKYAHLGRHFAISPIPGVSVTAGLETIGVPTLSMALDTDVPEINLALHMLPVLWAHIFARGETQEPLVQTLAVIDRLEALIPDFYRQSAGDPVTLQPDIIKDYGRLDGG